MYLIFLYIIVVKKLKKIVDLFFRGWYWDILYIVMLSYMVFDVCFRLDLLLLIGCLLINYYCKNLLYKLVFY